MSLHLQFLGFLFLSVFLVSPAWAKTHHHSFHVRSTPYTRLCKTKNILTVNGEFPGPTLHVRKGDTATIKAFNDADHNISLHWHGLKQPRNPWYDGPAYITQCPIQPGGKFIYKLNFTTEEGTIWWHAHSEWSRATVHGAIIIYPVKGTTYPFLKPHAQVPIILGEWWNNDITEVVRDALKMGGEPQSSDAFTINGQPGYLYPCSKPETFRMQVEQGKTYLLRMISAVMDEEMFFSIDRHSFTVVGIDASYTKPFATNILYITPGQTMDVLLTANQPPNLYSIAARAYSSVVVVGFDKSTSSAILEYDGPYTHSYIPSLPLLPPYNATEVATYFTTSLKSLADKDHPINVPLNIDTQLFFTISVNLLPCPGNSCKGPFGRRFSSSFNNISFVDPSIDILQAYYTGINGVFSENFPSKPPIAFDYTGQNLLGNLSMMINGFGTEVKVLEYNSNVELILQGTNVVIADNHPVHLHGYNFYVVGFGFGDFDPTKDPSKFNLVDPPQENSVAVPKNGWVAIRFKADNPGVWLMHCHLERHQLWGMSMVFIVKNGAGEHARLLSPPFDLPKC